MRSKVEEVGEVILDFISNSRPIVVGALVITGSIVILGITLIVLF